LSQQAVDYSPKSVATPSSDQIVTNNNQQVKLFFERSKRKKSFVCDNINIKMSEAEDYRLND
jgi:hypothetical protein